MLNLGEERRPGYQGIASFLFFLTKPPAQYPHRRERPLKCPSGLASRTEFERMRSPGLGVHGVPRRSSVLGQFPDPSEVFQRTDSAER